MLLSLLLATADVPNLLDFLALLHVLFVPQGLLFFVPRAIVLLRTQPAVAAHFCLLRLVRASRIKAPAPS